MRLWWEPMRVDIPIDEFAALVDTPADELRAWAGMGLLDPAGRGSFDELDLLRLMAIRHYGALGFEVEQTLPVFGMQMTYLRKYLR